MVIAYNLASYVGLLWCWSYSTTFFCINSCFSNSSSISMGWPGEYFLSFAFVNQNMYCIIDKDFLFYFYFYKFIKKLEIRFLLAFLLTIFQHPLIPPYGTPVPYPAIYPPGGVYAHPNMATVCYALLTWLFFCNHF